MKRLEFYKVYSWAAVQLGGMASAETMVFSVIWSFYENNKECFISLSEFAALIGCGKSTIQRAIRKLEYKNVIYIEPCNYRNSNSYTVDERIVDYWKQEFEKTEESKNSHTKEKPKEDNKYNPTADFMKKKEEEAARIRREEELRRRQYPDSSESDFEKLLNS